ncbi:MAG TPA: hypothetical protein VFI92_05530 [Steroidobacteraceae bacterium]|nr:hypothetical protein [Steroidobacteraceae bacterium]
MTDIDRREGDDPRLDAELRELPRAIAPGRDLWPGIAARLEPRESSAARRRPAWLWQAAAAVLLVAGSSLLTATLVDRDRGEGNMAAAPRTTTSAPAPRTTDVMAMPAAFGPGARLDADYVAARRQLTAMLEARMANLPESTRAKLQVNLAEMRRAADQINAALAEQPGDPLLEELLLMTYQDELAVLANVNQLTTALASAAEPAAGDAKRMQL